MGQVEEEEEHGVQHQPRVWTRKHRRERISSWCNVVAAQGRKEGYRFIIIIIMMTMMTMMMRRGRRIFSQCWRGHFRKRNTFINWWLHTYILLISSFFIFVYVCTNNYDNILCTIDNLFTLTHNQNYSMATLDKCRRWWCVSGRRRSRTVDRWIRWMGREESAFI